MCLILFAWQPDSNFPLIVSANRDEFYQRPTQTLAPWPDSPVIAGRDLQQGGTWLGITAGGRFAAVTNFRLASDMHTAYPLSRGALCRDFLQADCTPQEYLQQLSASAMQTGGFNLLVADRQSLAYASNRFPDGADGFCYQMIPELAAGVYGLSNHRLDTPWPKLTDRRQAFRQQLQQAGLLKNTQKILHNKNNWPEAELLQLLEDPTPAPDDQLPDTGIGPERERFLSPAFIGSSLDYGTRASTILIRDSAGRQTFTEQSWLAGGQRGCRTVLCLSEYAN